jgi:hypothetical protein
MRTLIICAAGVLTLAACQRPAEEPAGAPAAADTAIDATATDATGDPATPVATSTPRAATAPRPAKSATAAAAPAPAPAPADQGVMAGPSPAVRETAKERAEETNLHPAN